MKFLIAVAALVAVASAAPEERYKRGILSYAAPAVVDTLGSSTSTVISGPSGQIVSTQSNPAVVARSVYSAPAVVAAPSVYSAYAAPSVYSAYAAPAVYSAPTVVAAPSVYSAYAAAPAAVVAPGVTAGVVHAPGTTVVGPSTNGAPGHVITNTPFGTQILV